MIADSSESVVEVDGLIAAVRPQGRARRMSA